VHRSMKARQECMTPKAGIDRVGISYNEMISTCAGVSQINTPCYAVHVHYLSISVCVYAERLRNYKLYYDVVNLLSVTKTNNIDTMPCGCGTLRTTCVRICYQVSHRACIEVTATLEVTCRCAQRSQKLQILTIQIVKSCSFVTALP